MSFFDSIESAVTQLKSGIGAELNGVERNLGQLISGTATTVGTEFEKLFAKIRHLLDSVGDEIKTKMENVDRLLIEAKNAIEKGAETAYHDFINKTEEEIKRIKALAAEGVASLNAAGKYIKDKAENDVKHALSLAKKSFEDAKALFEKDVAFIVDGAISVTKKGIEKLVADAKEGTSKLNDLRIVVGDEIKGKFQAIEGDLVALKKKFAAEMDEVVSFGRREARKVEAKFEKMAGEAKHVANTVAVAALLFCIAAGIGIIFMKERRANAEYLEYKKSKSRK